MSGLIGYQSVTTVEELAKPLNFDIPAATEARDRASRLFNEAQLIRYYDEVLTQSARNFAFTQDEKWADRYGDTEPLLDRAIKRAMREGDAIDGQCLTHIDSANLALVEMEYRAISLVDQGQAAEAVAVLESEEYWAQKQIYWNGLKSFFDRVEVRDRHAHDISSNAIAAAAALAQSRVESSVRTIWVYSAVLLFAAVLVGFVVARSVIRPLNRLRKTAIELGNGNYSIRTNIETSDEIGAVARSIDQLAMSLDGTRTAEHNRNTKMAERH